MKLSANSLGIFIFTALATIAFIGMAKRPAVEGNQVMQFGMPLQTTATEKTIDKPELVNEKPAEEEEAISTDDSATTDDSAASEEPKKTEDKAEDSASKKAASEKK